MSSPVTVPRPDGPPRSVEPDPENLRERLTRIAGDRYPGARVTWVRRLAGGVSSLTYLAELDGAPEPRAVVKVAPAGLSQTRHRDVLRQARLLQSLAGTDGLPTPAVLFSDPGDDAEGALFAMSWCPGECSEPDVDDDPATVPGPRDLDARARHAARVLGRVHSPEALPPWAGEEPVLSLADEIERWDRALATVPADFGLDWAARSELLRAHLPAPTAPRLTHGDYRLGNLLCQGPLVTAVLDWEIWAVSDGRIDLGWFLLTLDGELHPAAVRSAEGVPARSDLVTEYLAAGGVPVPDLDWFLALALYKFTATTGLVGKHALRRGDTSSWGARMVPRLPAALRLVDELIGP